jgi:hypothetical protein
VSPVFPERTADPVGAGRPLLGGRRSPGHPPRGKRFHGGRGGRRGVRPPRHPRSVRRPSLTANEGGHIRGLGQPTARLIGREG